MEDKLKDEVKRMIDILDRKTGAGFSQRDAIISKQEHRIKSLEKALKQCSKKYPELYEAFEKVLNNR